MTRLYRTASFIHWFSWVCTFELCSMLIGQLSMPGPWYAQLYKSTITPAPWIFPLAWTLLYAFLATIGWELWQFKQSNRIKMLFCIQMILNFLWSFIFFKLHWILISLLSIFCMLFLTVILLIHGFKHQMITHYLLVPYAVWLCFAGYLTSIIWLYNT